MPDGYQSDTRITRSQQNRLDQQECRVKDSTQTLTNLNTIITALPTSTEFERGVRSALLLLTGQLTELKSDFVELKDEINFSNNSNNVEFEKLSRVTAQTEQYSRRDTVTVSGLSMGPAETEEQLSRKVADAISKCGTVVQPADFSVAHRNSSAAKLVRGKSIPPSVTVKFCKIAKKDSVLMNYKNSVIVGEERQAREVKVYQSLTKNYSDLRYRIVTFFKASSDVDGLDNKGKKLRWCTYKSPTAGFALKLDDGWYARDIHSWADFVRHFESNYN